MTYAETKSLSNQQNFVLFSKQIEREKIYTKNNRSTCRSEKRIDPIWLLIIHYVKHEWSLHRTLQNLFPFFLYSLFLSILFFLLLKRISMHCETQSTACFFFTHPLHICNMPHTWSVKMGEKNILYSTPHSH